MATPSGQFNKRIFILERKLEAGDHNQPIERWKRIGPPIPAKVRAISSEKTTEANQTVYHQEIQITIRQRELELTNKIELAGKTLRIAGIAEDDRDTQSRELILTCYS